MQHYNVCMDCSTCLQHGWLTLEAESLAVVPAALHGTCRIGLTVLCMLLQQQLMLWQRALQLLRHSQQLHCYCLMEVPASFCSEQYCGCHGQASCAHGLVRAELLMLRCLQEAGVVLGH